MKTKQKSNREWGCIVSTKIQLRTFKTTTKNITMLQMPCKWSHSNKKNNAQRCPRCDGPHHIKDCNQTEPFCANCNKKHGAAYKGYRKHQEAKQKTNFVSYAELPNYKSENTA